MIYRIKEGQDNNILFYDITVKDFSYLMEDDYNYIIREMVMESELFRTINLPNTIVDLMVDVIINDKGMNYLKEQLSENKVPLYSLIINIVNTYEKGYKKLLKMKEEKEIEIECTKNNFIKGLELAKRLNKKVLIDGRTITLSDYQELLSDYNIDSLANLDITIDYQERNSKIGIKELYETATAISGISKEISKYNLSPLEKIIYAYDKVKANVYKESDESKLNSRDLDKVLKGDSIVCVGFSNLFNAILKSLGINAMPLISKQKKHQRSLVYIEDSKYNINGVYAFDPTYDSKRNDSYIDNYAYFGLTLNDSEMNHPTIISKYIGLSFDEIVRVMKSEKKENFVESIDVMNNLGILFQFIKENNYKEFIEIISYYKFVSSSEKKRALEIYRDLINKYNSKEIPATTFMLALYNTRMIEYYNGLIEDFDIEDIKETAINRGFQQKFNCLEEDDDIHKMLDTIYYEIEMYDTMDEMILQRNSDIERQNLNIRLLKVLRNGRK